MLTRTNGCGGRPRADCRVSPRAPSAYRRRRRPVLHASRSTPTSTATAEKLATGATVSLDGQVKVIVKTNTWNAVGRLPGSDPARAREMIVLSAHIDHLGTGRGGAAGADTIYNGADDDASGCVAVLELARGAARGAARSGR